MIRNAAKHNLWLCLAAFLIMVKIDIVTQPETSLTHFHMITGKVYFESLACVKTSI